MYLIDVVAMFLGMTRLCSALTVFFFLMIRRPPRSTLDRSSAASDVYKRQHVVDGSGREFGVDPSQVVAQPCGVVALGLELEEACLLYTSPSPRDRTRSRMPSSA